MSFFTDLNNYIKTLSSDWVLVEGNNENTVYLENEKDESRICIEYHQEVIVRDGKVKPYIWGSVGVYGYSVDNYDDVEKIAFDVNEIIRKNT